MVARPIFGKIYQNLVVMTIGIGHMTDFWQKLPRFGRDDNWNLSSDQFLVTLPKFGQDDNWNWLYDQFLVNITKIWSCDQYLVKFTKNEKPDRKGK